MIFRLDRFFFDEKDLFTFFFGIFLLVAAFLDFPVEPFRQGSLVVLFLFLAVTRSIVHSVRYEGYLYITLLGLLFSLFLSPYGLAIYLFVATFIYTKTQRI